MKKFYAKKASDPQYRLECEHERNANFLATDVNMNGSLDLDEWKAFCRMQVANISQRCGVNMNTTDEEHMEISWRINQFEGKGGITPSDFKKKSVIDIKLMTEMSKK